MEAKLIGNKKQFAIGYCFFDDSHETEFSMYINNNNILSFKKDRKLYTTRWNLDELVLWLRKFLDHMTEDPYPVNVEGEYAAVKDINARDFDTDNDAEFDAYYDKLDDWNLRHRWHTASSGAILADVYFQQVGNFVEISWNNEDAENGVKFKNILGGEKVEKLVFTSIVDQFLKNYAFHWFN